MTSPQAAKLIPRRAPRFDLCAGSVCLDFINTLDDRFSGEPKELLKTYYDLGRFGAESGILTSALVDRLSARNILAPDEAGRALASAIRLREVMFQIFWPIVQRKPVPRAAVRVLNAFVQSAGRHVELAPGKGRFVWQFDFSRDDLEAPLWPIARSAGDLLTSDRLELVKACASKTCEWLFLDESKNHRRRWCDMTKCGNRAKFQRFYTRQKKEFRLSSRA
jgi:predicted RNA-binding Zn ribbon-like protein